MGIGRVSPWDNGTAGAEAVAAIVFQRRALVHKGLAVAFSVAGGVRNAMAGAVEDAFEEWTQCRE